MQLPEIITDPARRHDVVLLFDVTRGNPNGDPDADNMPRFDPETMHGLVTDVCLKRKIRDYLATVHGVPIFIQSRVTLNALIGRGFRDAGVQLPALQVNDEAVVDWFRRQESADFVLDDENKLTYGGESAKRADIQKVLHALLAGVSPTFPDRELREALRDLDDEEQALQPKLQDVARQLAALLQGTRAVAPGDRDRARMQLCRDYYDIRMFGAVLQTGLNAGQVRGPFQLVFGRSIDPIRPLDLTITRQARTTAARAETGTTEMGRKPMIPYGLYRTHGFFNPLLAAQTGVTTQDLGLLWEAMINMFEYDRSAARGEMAVRGIYVFSHANGLGSAPSHRLFERIRVERRDGVEKPRFFDDYVVQVQESGLPAGVTLTPLVA